MTQRTSDMATTYAEDGYVAPIDILTAAEARVLRDDFESAEAELANDPAKLKLLNSYPDRLLPSFDVLIRHPQAHRRRMRRPWS